MGLLLFDAFDVTAVEASITDVIAALVNPTDALTAGVDDPSSPDHRVAPAPRLFSALASPGAIPQAPRKDPREALDYSISYAAVLAPGETIVQSTWLVTRGGSVLVIGTGSRAPTFDAGSTTLWLLGGRREPYRVTNHVVTSHDPPREYERSFDIVIADQ